MGMHGESKGMKGGKVIDGPEAAPARFADACSQGKCLCQDLNAWRNRIRGDQSRQSVVTCCYFYNIYIIVLRSERQP